MPTTRLFAYNTGSLIPGTTQVGSIAVSESPSLNYSINPNYMWVKDLDLILFEPKTKTP
jgi:hypothetical protein